MFFCGFFDMQTFPNFKGSELYKTSYVVMKLGDLKRVQKWHFYANLGHFLILQRVRVVQNLMFCYGLQCYRKQYSENSQNEAFCTNLVIKP